jgi:hypothetical protein
LHGGILCSAVSGAQYGFEAYCLQVEWGGMDELVGRIVSNVGIEPSMAAKVVGIMLDFFTTQGSPEKTQALLDRLPGAAEAIEAARADRGGLLGAMPGIMGAGSRMMSAGLAMEQIQPVVREFIAYARENAGAEEIDGIIGSIPGASQFI